MRSKMSRIRSQCRASEGYPHAPPCGRFRIGRSNVCSASPVVAASIAAADPSVRRQRHPPFEGSGVGPKMPLFCFVKVSMEAPKNPPDCGGLKTSLPGTVWQSRQLSAGSTNGQCSTLVALKWIRSCMRRSCGVYSRCRVMRPYGPPRVLQGLHQRGWFLLRASARKRLHVRR